ncbi:SusD/RagB family nutrient-binding outer membrane lipoprotein [Chitinophagaceae bacterium IBVUCB2]|nr:SusD/RagB family nutrient-binding outer membrane lipoprotein [Chitinophagaceae bacterium IBVUCB2]
MKIFKRLILIICSGCFLTACDKDFERINTNPYAVTDIDPALLLAGAQRTHLGTWNAEHIIVQQFVVPYNTGATQGFSFNKDIDGNSNPKWDQSYANGSNGNAPPVKNLTQALNMLGASTTRINLQSMIRIWKAQVFMGLVDNYGDIPYSEAGKAVSDVIFYPKYDDDAAIYDDLYKELKESVAALSTSGEYISADLFYGANAQPSTKTTTAADQATKWKKLGNSLLLRLGMRYTRLNPAKAQSIVTEALAGGVMTSNADNAFVKNDGTAFSQPDNAALRNFSQFNYAAEPFVNQLKLTNDPRGKFLIAQYADPGAIANNLSPDMVLANQYGVPIGVTSDQILAPGPYRGGRGSGLNYSQFNVNIIAAQGVPEFWVTYAQTSLLLADAAKRGWIPGSDAQAKIYYDNAIAADMAAYSLYTGTTPISGGEVTAYINDPAVAYTPADALRLINTQYWIVNIRNGTEAFANFRRSGFPALTPNPVAGDLGSVGFARRLSYPDLEASANTANYNAASTAIGGDKLSSRVFWDKP